MSDEMLRHQLRELQARVEKLEAGQIEIKDHLINTNHHLGLAQDRIIRILESPK